MIRVNLLPHREMRRERRKKEFIGLMAATGIAGAVVALVVGSTFSQMVSAQEKRNEFLRTENAKLDTQIKEIATLRAEIDSLRKRQEAVENLQADRTIPVHLLDELVRQMPEGMHLRNLRQDDLKIAMTGTAQSQERVAELIRNILYNAPWLEKPELGEIKAVPINSKEKDSKRIFEFTVNAMLKRQAKPDAKSADAGQPVAVPVAQAK